MLERITYTVDLVFLKVKNMLEEGYTGARILLFNLDACNCVLIFLPFLEYYLGLLDVALPLMDVLVLLLEKKTCRLPFLYPLGFTLDYWISANYKFRSE